MGRSNLKPSRQPMPPHQPVRSLERVNAAPQDLFEQQIGFLMWDTTRKISREFAALIAGYHINSGWVPFLRSLHRRDGVTQRELANSVQMRTSTTLHALRELERRKLVFRNPSLEDRRKIYVFLTDKGREICGAIAPEAEKFNRRLLRGLRVHEQETLRDLLRRMRENMSAPLSK